MTVELEEELTPMVYALTVTSCRIDKPSLISNVLEFTSASRMKTVK